MSGKVRDFSSVVKDHIDAHIKAAKCKTVDASKIKCCFAYECNLATIWDRTSALSGVCESQGSYVYVLLKGKRLFNHRYINIKPLELFVIDRSFKVTKETVKTTTADEYIISICGKRYNHDALMHCRISFATYEGGEEFSKKINNILQEVNSKKDIIVAGNFQWLEPFEQAAKVERDRLEIKKQLTEDDNTGPTSARVGPDNVPLRFDTNLANYSRTSAIALILMAGMELVNPIGVNHMEEEQQREEAGEPPRDITPVPQAKKSRFGRKKAPEAIKMQDSPEVKSDGESDPRLMWDGIPSGSESDSQEIALPIDISCPDFISNRLDARQGEYCSWKTHNVYAGVWYVEQAFDAHLSLDNWLSPPAQTQPPDIYVLGLIDTEAKEEGGGILQKVGHHTTYQQWIKRIEASAPFKATEYTRLKHSLFQGLFTVVYVKSRLRKYFPAADLLTCQFFLNVQDDSGQRMNPKKGSFADGTRKFEDKHYPKVHAIRMGIYNSNLCFVTLQLPPGSANSLCRERCIAKLYKKIWFQVSEVDRMLLEDHDFILLLGSFNFGYAANANMENLSKAIERKDVATLLASDEVLKQLNKMPELQSYREAAITFLPNAPFKKGSAKYDRVGTRDIPSYMDRILFRGKRVENKFYRVHSDYQLSSHKPISAYFTVGLREINDNLLKMTYEAIVQSSDILINVGRSNIQMDKMELNFGELSFLSESNQAITVSNPGIVTADFSLYYVPSNMAATNLNAPLPPLPQWLKVEPDSACLERGKTLKMMFTVRINAESIGDIQVGRTPLDANLIFKLRDGGAKFIAISGKLKPTSYGMPVYILSQFSEPIRQVQPDLLDIKRKQYLKAVEDGSANSKECRIPKELVRLVEHISKNHLSTPELFVRPTLPHQVGDVIEALDTTPPSAPLPTAIEAHEYAEALKLYLSSLPEPIIPYEVVTKDNSGFSSTMSNISTLTPTQRTLFAYIMSFLKKVLENKSANSLNTIKLATVFGSVLIGIDPLLGQSNREQRTAFIKYFLENDISMLSL